MKKLKKIAAMAAAIVLCMSCAFSCGKEKTKTPQTADMVLTNSYKSVELTAPENVADIQGATYLKDCEKVILSCYDENYDTVLYSTDLEFTDYTKIDAELDLNTNAQNSFIFAPADDGTLYALLTSTTHGDMEEPNWDDPDFDYENFDYEAYEAAAESTYTIYKLDSEGKQISKNEIKDLDKAIETDYGIYISGIICCGEDQILARINGNSESLVILNTDGSIGDKIKSDDINWIDGLGKDSSGKIVCTAYNNEGQGFYIVDTEKKTLEKTDTVIDNNNSYTIGGIIGGTGDYIVFLPTNNGIFGIKEDGTYEEIVNWIDSDIDGSNISSVLGLDNGDFIIFERGGDYNSVKLSRLTRRAAEELSDTMVITIGLMWSDSQITEKITEFNKSNDKYRIKIKDYSEYDDYNEETEKYDNTSADQLKNDIISGKAPDIICIYDNSVINSLASKGVFADLYPFMEKDSEVTKDKFLPNILEALENDGKLYSMSPSFTVNTLIAKTKFADKENWTFDDMIETYNNLPEGMKLLKGENNKNQVFSYFWYTMMSDFLDFENGSCSFDSPEFIKFLEFCDTFEPADEDAYNTMMENMTDDEMNPYWTDVEMECKNDKALLDNMYISMFSAYGEKRYGYFGDEITFVGSPSSDGQGAFLSFNYNMAILSDSGCKDAAWEFIRTFYTEESQNELLTNYGGIPVTSASFEKMADESMSRPYYLDENGEKVEYDNGVYIGNNEIKIPPLTQEERDTISDYIKGITKVSGGYDVHIQEVIDEEIKAFFAGDKTAEEAAKMIQNRISIYISEKN